MVCALDTELLGHWWYEGIAWLEAVVEECARQGLELVRLDDALERSSPRSRRRGAPRTAGGRSSWGDDGDLSTWSGPAVAEMAFAARAAELEVVAAGARAGAAAVRELLALQASDWPFMVSRELAGPVSRASASRATAGRSSAPRAGAASRRGGAAQPRRRRRSRCAARALTEAQFEAFTGVGRVA